MPVSLRGRTVARHYTTAGTAAVGSRRLHPLRIPRPTRRGERSRTRRASSARRSSSAGSLTTVHFPHTLALIESLYLAGKRAEVISLSARSIPCASTSVRRDRSYAHQDGTSLEVDHRNRSGSLHHRTVSEGSGHVGAPSPKTPIRLYPERIGV